VFSCRFGSGSGKETEALKKIRGELNGENKKEIHARIKFEKM
jgi:hypothetical protein